jgi:hypothetical protein
VGWWQREATTEHPPTGQIAQAEQEARYALALLARLGRKATTELRQEVLIERVALPVLDGVGRTFGPRRRLRATTNTNGGRAS